MPTQLTEADGFASFRFSGNERDALIVLPRRDCSRLVDLSLRTVEDLVVEISLPICVNVVVLDDREVPVPGARVVFQSMAEESLHVAGVTDGRGELQCAVPSNMSEVMASCDDGRMTLASSFGRGEARVVLRLIDAIAEIRLIVASADLETVRNGEILLEPVERAQYAQGCLDPFGLRTLVSGASATLYCPISAGRWRARLMCGAVSLWEKAFVPREKIVTLTLELARQKTIVSQIFSEDGLKVAGAEVFAETSDEVRWAMSDDQGEARLIVGAGSRIVRLLARHKEFGNGECVAELGAVSSEFRCNLSLRRLNRFWGRVLCADGQPARWAQVQLRGDSGERIGVPCAVDSAGRFAFAGVKAKNVVADVLQWRYLNNSLSVSFPLKSADSGTAGEVELRLSEAGCGIEFDVVPINCIVRSGRVVIQAKDSRRTDQLGIDEEERCVKVLGLREGTFVVRALGKDESGNDLMSWPVEVVTEKGGILRRTIRVYRTGELSVIGGGVPLQIQISREGVVTPTVEFDGKGSFVRQVPEGQYDLCVYSAESPKGVPFVVTVRAGHRAEVK